MQTFTLEQIGDLVQKATENYDAVVKQNQDILAKLQTQGDKFTELKGQFDALKDGGDADALAKLAGEIEDCRTQMDGLAGKLKTPVSAITDEKQVEAIKAVARKSIGEFYKQGAKMQTPDFFSFIKSQSEAQLKTLNITAPESAGLAVAEVLDRDVLEYARDFSPILEQIGRKASLTRSYRQMIKISYPTVEMGIENVAGVVPAETDTQTYTEIRAREFKLYVSPRITNEALYGTDIDVYSDLVQSLGEEIGVYLTNQLLYGNGQDKNCRGIYSSQHLSFATGGKSFKPTLGADRRDPDFYPVFSTGVAGKIAAADEGIVDWVIDFMTQLPKKYRSEAEFTMTEATANIFKKLKDANGHPIFIASYKDGGEFTLFGKKVVIDDFVPELAANSAFIRYGITSKAKLINAGDIDQMLLDPYTKKGSTIVYMEKEYFEITGHSDALIFGVACAHKE